MPIKVLTTPPDEEIAYPDLVRLLRRATIKIRASDLAFNVPLTIGPVTFYADRIDVVGGVRIVIRTVTTTQAIALTDYTILADATAGNITLTLPAVSGRLGLIYNVKKIDGSANTVTIDGNASETIDGATTKVLTTQWQSFMLQTDGAAWYIIG